MHGVQIKGPRCRCVEIPFQIRISEVGREFYTWDTWEGIGGDFDKDSDRKRDRDNDDYQRDSQKGQGPVGI